jgi:hypothetical protein
MAGDPAHRVRAHNLIAWLNREPQNGRATAGGSSRVSVEIRLWLPRRLVLRRRHSSASVFGSYPLVREEEIVGRYPLDGRRVNGGL